MGNSTVRHENRRLVNDHGQIGPAKVPNRMILAPISGSTDAPLPWIAERHGAGLVVSGMGACTGLVEGKCEADVRSEVGGIEAPGRAAV